MNLRELILKLIETNSRLTPAEISVLLAVDELLVEKTIAEMEADNIICGYHTLINWDKADSQDVSAMIELRVNPQRGQGFDRIAEKIYLFPEVESVYLMSGGFDLMVQLKKAPMKEIANFVSSRLSIIEEVQGTATHIILKKYKEHGTIYVKEEEHRRQVVTP